MRPVTCMLWTGNASRGMSADTEDASGWTTVHGRLRKGYGVASGQAPDSPYPEGRIVIQTPHFLRLGLDIRRFFPGTLNVSIAPYVYRMRRPRWTFPRVEWYEGLRETFSFSPCRLVVDQGAVEALVYRPHPETKPDHFQDDSTLEILAPFLGELEEGAELTVRLLSREVEVFGRGEAT